jgi:hypothetical protein
VKKRSVFGIALTGCLRPVFLTALGVKSSGVGRFIQMPGSHPKI